MIVVAPSLVRSASSSAMPSVPLANFSNSKTPILQMQMPTKQGVGFKIRNDDLRHTYRGYTYTLMTVSSTRHGIRTYGPFQTMVLQGLSAAEKDLMESGPISSPIQPSGIASA